MKPPCQQFLGLLIDYVADALDGAIAVECREHLDGCVSCVVFMETYRATITFARALPRDEPLPPGLEERLRERMRAAATGGE